MATITLGTTANNSLTALIFAASNLAADLATINAGIKNMQVVNGARPVLPDAFTRFGKLLIPNRGYVDVLPGDAVAIDGNGWPILIAGQILGNSPWVHT